jgi:AcrR family transcriptional regulator
MSQPRALTKSDDFAVRPPQQQRSRESWERILTAGVELLCEGGYEAFTIAAVCDRAGVPPRAIYARVDAKEGLFLAVYEHGMAHVREQVQAVFENPAVVPESASRQVDDLVRGIADVFHGHRAFLKPVLLLSSTHPEVHRRGSAYSREMGENFTSALRQVVYSIEHEEPAAALQFCFSMVHSAVVMRTMYGAGFAVPPVSQEQFAESLATAASRYLFARPEA